MNKYKHLAPSRTSVKNRLYSRIHSRRDGAEDRQCRGKMRYETEAEALKEQPLQRAYACQFCGGFHLTTKT